MALWDGHTSSPCSPPVLPILPQFLAIAALYECCMIHPKQPSNATAESSRSRTPTRACTVPAAHLSVLHLSCSADSTAPPTTPECCAVPLQPWPRSDAMGLFEIIRLGSILSVIRYTAHRGYAYRGRAPRTEGGTGEAPYVSGPGGVPGTGCSPVIPKSVQFTNPETLGAGVLFKLRRIKPPGVLFARGGGRG